MLVAQASDVTKGTGLLFHIIRVSQFDFELFDICMAIAGLLRESRGASLCVSKATTIYLRGTLMQVSKLLRTSDPEPGPLLSGLRLSGSPRGPQDLRVTTCLVFSKLAR